jgi:hypothetical protein
MNAINIYYMPYYIYILLLKHILYIFKKISNQTTHKLLLNDDDVSARLLIHDILEGANVTIIECGCGNEALDLFKKYKWVFMIRGEKK